MKRQFGIRTEGTELEFEKLIQSVVQTNYFSVFVELGAAGCRTLKSMHEIIEETRDEDTTYVLASVDIPQGFVSEYKEISKNFPSDLLIIDASGLNSHQKVQPSTSTPQLILTTDGAKFLRENWDIGIDFCFIDANHNKQSVINDFLAVEPHIPVGGIVAFHDFGKFEQGTDPQPGGGFIEVREACKELGLLDEPIRASWKFVKEIKGSRYEGGEGNSIGVFERVEARII